MKILLEKTDEDNTITLYEMIAEPEKVSISAERKSIYDDIAALRHYGLDIASRKTRTTNYYLISFSEKYGDFTHYIFLCLKSKAI